MWEKGIRITDLHMDKIHGQPYSKSSSKDSEDLGLIPSSVTVCFYNSIKPLNFSVILLTIWEQDISCLTHLLNSWSRSRKSSHNCSVEQNTLFLVRCCHTTLLSFVRAFSSLCEFTSVKNSVSTANLVKLCTSFLTSSVDTVYVKIKKAIKITF